MNRIKQLFQRKKENILNVYFTAGFPNKEDTVIIINALDEAGADLIEIGMPYSDPLADGPTIHESGSQALKNGMNLPLLFQQIKEARQKTEIPLVMMGYFNQVLQYGVDRFLDHAKEAGVDGFILPDLPLYEYEEIYKEKIEKHGFCISFLMTPQTNDDRVQLIDTLSSGFVYVVSSAAITGAKQDISTQQIDYFERVRNLKLQNPTLIGFGISNHETYSTACQYANGVIIGSAYIKALTEGNDIAQTTKDFVSMIRNV